MQSTEVEVTYTCCGSRYIFENRVPGTLLYGLAPRAVEAVEYTDPLHDMQNPECEEEEE